MKITRKQFILFKKECRYWMNRFQINDTHVAFQFGETISGNDAVCASQPGGNTTFGLSTKIDEPDLNDYVKYLAKHEVLHCLLAKFSYKAHSRFTTKDDILDEEEYLVRKLVNIIK